MIRWTPKFDISTVPDNVLLAESAKRLRARQGDGPRPKVLRDCEFCHKPFGARAMREHRPVCPKRHNLTPVTRPGWTIQIVTDPEEQNRQNYRYWQSRPVGERLAAVWDVTQAAYSIQKVG